MSIFNWIGDIFGPVADAIDNVHTSTEEKGQIQIELQKVKSIMAETEAKVATKVLDFQSQLVEANSKVAMAEQQHGNWLSKSWRPICSIGSFVALVAMGTDVMVYNQFLATIFGSFLGIYTGARSWEKKK